LKKTPDKKDFFLVNLINNKTDWFTVTICAFFLTIFVVFVASIESRQSILKKIDPEKTYTIVDVTDSSGKNYRNLIELTKYTFRDYHGNVYNFNGNFTAITRQVTGEQLLKEVQQLEKSHGRFPIESIY